MSRRSREEKEKEFVWSCFFLSCCCKAFLCLVDIDVLSSFSRVMFPNRSTWRTTFTVLHLARTTKNFVVRRYRVSVESPAVDLPVDDSLSPLFNIFLITVKIDFQSCLPQQLVLSWGGSLSLLCSHVCHRRDRFKNFLLFFFVSFPSRFQLFRHKVVKWNHRDPIWSERKRFQH